MHPLLIATTNPGKYTEMIALLGQLPYHCLSLRDLPTPLIDHEVPETGRSCTANARIKAIAYGQLSGYLTLADDSGLVVDALNGRPGIYAHRYGTSDQQRINRLLHELKAVPPTQRHARFICACAIYEPVHQTVFTCRGSVKGFITTSPKGSQNFGYDPLFYCPLLGKTFAQATLNEKNTVSHRARATKQARRYLLKLSSTTGL